MTFIHYYLSRAGVSLWQLLFPTAGTSGGDNPITFFRCLNVSRAPPEIWLQLWALCALKIWPWPSASARPFPKQPEDNAESPRHSSPGTHSTLRWHHTSPASVGWPAGLSSTATATSQAPPGGHQIHTNLPPKMLCHGKLRVVLGHSLLLFIFLKNQNLLLTF